MPRERGFRGREVTQKGLEDPGHGSEIVVRLCLSPRPGVSILPVPNLKRRETVEEGRRGTQSRKVKDDCIYHDESYR